MQVLAHNLLSQFTNRQLKITSKEKGKSSEKLASGYRINRGADDAAGLQISEKMRSQVRGLNQASRNIQDGISLCQVADGALNETHSILQRMRELSVQAANDTNQELDRDAIQSEINELTKEVDRIANDTSFNHGIYPLQDENSVNSSSVLTLDDIKAQLKEITTTVTITENSVILDDILYNVGDIVTVTGLYGNNPSIDDISLVLLNGYTISENDNNILKASNAWYNNVIYSVHLSDLEVDSDGYVRIFNKAYDKISGVNSNKYYLYLTKGYNYNIDDRLWGFDYKDNWAPETCFRVGVTAKENNNTKNDKAIWIQTGANSGQGIFLSLVNATAKGIGITDPTLDVTSYDNASTSISRLDNAINKVSSYRSKFGAQQNRLEYARSVDNNTAENTQYAESRIRDADMADEMVKYSKHNILEQAAQSMLAHANQSTQGILALLQ